MERFIRYIVECKDSELNLPYSTYIGFNRYIVECKATGCLFYFKKGWDLIDTLWNVKRYFNNASVRAFYDLIDTLWNVKFYSLSISACVAIRI